ncbi:hypothetical protein HanXRQr2_Chr08g0332181 [Helianthus annuus]|uniref:Uncharacterized protein n=2 Tax=Helianthus annuus TaxID=4232 RepID=A0A9K3NCU6_HELAN|nr:hypothetical protein HanXRQr2_Chr08g0332181 [Helianthus annuus]
MVSLSNWMMGRCCYTRPQKARVLKNHVDVYASPLGFRWKPYATEREKERWRTRSRKASSPSSSQTFHRHLDAGHHCWQFLLILSILSRRVSEGTHDEKSVFM